MPRIYLTLKGGARAAFNIDHITVVVGAVEGVKIVTTDCSSDSDAYWNVTESYDDVIARLCLIDDGERQCGKQA